MALGDELAVLTACDDELYVLIGARALCVQWARTRTPLRKSVPWFHRAARDNMASESRRVGAY